MKRWHDYLGIHRLFSDAVFFGRRKADGEPRFWLSWHNDNERPDGTKGPLWRAGRLFWYWPHNRTASVEWTTWKRHGYNPVMLTFGIDRSDSEIFLYAGCGLVAFYLTLEGFIRWPWPVPHKEWNAYTSEERRRIHDHCEARELSLSWHDTALWWNFWTPRDEWTSETPKWRHGSFRPADFLCGRERYTKTVLTEETVAIPMPEGSYEARIQLTLDRWKRPRWPFAKEIRRAHIDVEKGIPHPGKGENAWDCGDDALLGLTCPAKTIEEAVGKTVQSVLRDRERYGGSYAWTPGA